jgi:hypothetical protein
MAQPPRIVAELGRPETPEETAARKAENSRTRRANQTGLNLVLALAASLGIVFFLVLVVVRPDPPAKVVDYAAIAQDAQGAVDVPLATPVLPPGWSANSARFSEPATGITEWRVGFLTPSSQFIGLREGIDANETWLDDAVASTRSTTTTEIDGVDWSVYDNRDADDPGNVAYALSSTIGDGTIVLYGTASDEEFITLASAVAAELQPAPAEVAP